MMNIPGTSRETDKENCRWVFGKLWETTARGERKSSRKGHLEYQSIQYDHQRALEMILQDCKRRMDMN